MIFVTTSRLSPWYVEGRDVTVNPTLNQLVSGAYGEQPQEPALTGWNNTMALPGSAFNSRRLELENNARKELHESYNKLFK